MTPFASIALIRRNGSVVFKPPRKERPDDLTQARKAAVRYWRGNMAESDTLVRVILVREYDGKLQVSERGHNNGHDNPWLFREREIAEASREAHIAACLKELGISANDAPAALPDVLTINGATYRREI